MECKLLRLWLRKYFLDRVDIDLQLDCMFLGGMAYNEFPFFPILPYKQQLSWWSVLWRYTFCDLVLLLVLEGTDYKLPLHEVKSNFLHIVDISCHLG